MADPRRDPGELAVTESSLASALAGFYLWIRPDYTQTDIKRNSIFGTVEDADGVAEVLYATLSRMAALPES